MHVTPQSKQSQYKVKALEFFHIQVMFIFPILFCAGPL